jgi:hypothetical protein
MEYAAYIIGGLIFGFIAGQFFNNNALVDMVEEEKTRVRQKGESQARQLRQDYVQKTTLIIIEAVIRTEKQLDKTQRQDPRMHQACEIYLRELNELKSKLLNLPNYCNND